MTRMIAAILLLLSLPFIVLTCLFLLLTGVKPFFVQPRLGKEKKAFQIYKFRTMHQGKVTFLGKFLRKTGWDEWPQLINIVAGQMAFVGPRPLTEEDVRRLNWDGPEQAFRWTVRPGITGLAQLQRKCDANLSLQNDRIYVENKDWKLDGKLLFRSLVVPLIGK
ncbi:MAG: sugar transferase [Bacteroidetes bacterium]|nr:MAG: sugar transferase [Bacteroidota bacterium]